MTLVEAEIPTGGVGLAVGEDLQLTGGEFEARILQQRRYRQRNHPGGLSVLKREVEVQSFTGAGGTQHEFYQAQGFEGFFDASPCQVVLDWVIRAFAVNVQHAVVGGRTEADTVEAGILADEPV